MAVTEWQGMSNDTSSKVNKNSASSQDVLAELADVLEQRKSAYSGDSYVASLYQKGLDHILKKVGEEATETVLAAKTGDKDQIVYETADLWFHTLVMLAQQDLRPEQVLAELARRFGVSGHDEKASRTMTSKGSRASDDQ